MNLINLVGTKAAQKIKISGINVLHACEKELIYIAGKAAAKKITAAKELIISNKEEIREINSSNDIFQIFKDLQFLDIEKFEILALNRRNKIIERIMISQGGTACTIVDMKVLFKRLLTCGAHNFICVHNHPSGSKIASENDLNLTRKISEASKLLDIKLLDHIIICGNDYISFVDKGYL